MSAEETILSRIEKKLDRLLTEQRKRTWVKVGFVQDITGWNNRQLEAARKANLITYRKKDNSMDYLLESIPDQFIKQKSPATNRAIN